MNAKAVCHLMRLTRFISVLDLEIRIDKLSSGSPFKETMALYIKNSYEERPHTKKIHNCV